MGKPQETNKPEIKFRASAITATVWKNTGKTKDDKEYEFLTTQIERSYKDKDDKWQKTSSFRADDLPKVILVAQKAYEFIALQGNE
ncbi:MAG: hypothetical protein ABIB71_08165 [Candidatus Woesearchaeota archaeon]